MRLILLLSALLSAIAGYSPAAAARPVEAGQMLCVAQRAATSIAARPVNSATPATLPASREGPVATTFPLYADRLLI